MTVQKHPSLHTEQATSLAREIAEAGTVAGLIGGVAMALFATSYAAIIGIGFWTPVKAIGATVLGAHTLDDGGAPVVLLGLAIHVVASIAFGVLFALAAPRDVSPAPAFAFGEFAGVTLLVVMTLAVIPLVNPTARASLIWGSSPNALPVVVAFVMHFIYGAGLSLAPALRRHFSAGS